MQDIFLNAFPSFLADDIKVILNKIPLTSSLDPNGGVFEVLVHDEILRIPYRIYYDEPDFDDNLLTPLQHQILHCLFTRHNNGYVREKHLKQLLSSCNDEIWILPYILQLLGEYVIEVLEVVNHSIRSFNQNSIISFASTNPNFIQTTESRVISYWNEYYRRTYPNKQDYIGFQVLEYLQTIIREPEN